VSLKCQCEPKFRSACYGDAEYEHGDGQYCILHLPSDDKKDDFKKASRNKLLFNKALRNKLEQSDFNFRGTFFPSDTPQFKDFKFTADVHFIGATFCEKVDFSGAEFSKGADFEGATFSGTTEFSKAKFSGKLTNFQYARFSILIDFHEAEFSGETYFSRVEFSGLSGLTNLNFLTNFSKAKFNGKIYFTDTEFSIKTYFSGAEFSKEASFRGATFSEMASFRGATFSEMVSFEGATFSEMASFEGATFKEDARFYALKASPSTVLAFSGATMEKPERFSFHTTSLRPSWFVDVDAQKFDFSDVEWFRLPNGDPLVLEDEIKALQPLNVPPDQEKSLRKQSLRKLAKVCGKLMHNAEENRDYPTANEMHYWSMEARREEGWRMLGLTGTLYWMLSGYGARPARTVAWILMVWLVFSGLYWLAGFSSLGQSFIYSLSAVVGKGPRVDSAQDAVVYLLVALQIGLVAILAKLLVAAIRRQFMK
jgi:uncharacterized protein YjbI with pentapeptide repeats